MKDKIYRNSPYFLKYILVNIKAYQNKKKRYNNYYSKYYEELVSNFNSSDKNRVLDYQKSKLIDLLTECFDFSNYYRGIFDRLNITREFISEDPYGTLRILPILEKKTLREESEELVNTNVKRKVSSLNFTSGTTGTPTKTYYDYESEAISFALWNRFHYMIGLDKRDKHIRLSYKQVVNLDQNRSPFWIYNRIDNQLLMSVYHLNEGFLKSYIDKIQEFKPIYIDGSPSAIHILADYINRRKISLSFTLKGICTTAETLFDHQRADIEKAFKCKVYNQYASSEGSPFITECKNGKMHLNEDSGFFEVLDAENKEVINGIGKLVITSLRSWKTPLIRYDIGDFIEVNRNSKCSCGSPFKVVERVLGRANDLFWIKSKGYVRANVSSCLVQVKGVVEMQIIQKKPSYLVVFIVVGKEFTRDYEEIISNNLKDSLGDEVEIKYEYVDEIVQNNKGKFKFIVREFNVEDYSINNGKDI